MVCVRCRNVPEALEHVEAFRGRDIHTALLLDLLQNVVTSREEHKVSDAGTRVTEKMHSTRMHNTCMLTEASYRKPWTVYNRAYGM